MIGVDATRVPAPPGDQASRVQSFSPLSIFSFTLCTMIACDSYRIMRLERILFLCFVLSLLAVQNLDEDRIQMQKRDLVTHSRFRYNRNSSLRCKSLHTRCNSIKIQLRQSILSLYFRCNVFPSRWLFACCDNSDYQTSLWIETETSDTAASIELAVINSRSNL